MADDWLGISSANIDSYCAHYSSYTPDCALDGVSPGYWACINYEIHWLILDLGQTYTIKKVRGRSSSARDPIDVNIYVSDDKANWGAAVATGISTWQDTTTWQEVDTTDKDGRYIKIEIVTTEDADPGRMNFGKSAATFITIFDAYGDVAAGGVAWEKSLSDTVAIADLISKGVGVVEADSLSLSESIGKATELSKSDAVAVADAILTEAEYKRSLTDSVAIADIISKAMELPQADSIAIADALAKTVGLNKADSIVLADAIAKVIELSKADSIAIAESLAKGIGLSKADSILIADSLTKAIELVKSDTLALADSIAKAIELLKADNVSIADALDAKLYLLLCAIFGGSHIIQIIGDINE